VTDSHDMICGIKGLPLSYNKEEIESFIKEVQNVKD